MARDMDAEQAVRGYAAEVVERCAPERITAVRRFPSGERHAVYRVTYVAPTGGTEDVVVRVARSVEARECSQAEREASVLAVVQGAAAPVLYDFRCHSAWFDGPAMCVQFVDGDQRDLRDGRGADLEQLGSLLAWVHGRPLEPLRGALEHPGSVTAYLHRRLEVTARRLVFVRDPLPASVQQRLRHLWRLVSDRAEAMTAAQDAMPLVEACLLHGDVSGANIVWSPAPVLIDWEFARLGDPADEIASMFGQHELDESQRAAFWRGYASASPGRVEDLIHRALWWEPVTLFGSAMWWLERWTRRADADASGSADEETPNGQEHYAAKAGRRLDRVESLLRVPIEPSGCP